jgi:hypothetical protein
VPAGVPKTPFPVLVLVGGAALLVGVLVVLAIVLLR